MNRISIPTSLAILTLLVACGTSESGTGGEGGAGGVDFATFEWTELNGNAPWAARAGLHTVELDGRFYLMGGRTPTDPMGAPFIPADFWADGWVSEDEGVSFDNHELVASTIQRSPSVIDFGRVSPGWRRRWMT